MPSSFTYCIRTSTTTLQSLPDATQPELGVTLAQSEPTTTMVRDIATIRLMQISDMKMASEELVETSETVTVSDTRPKSLNAHTQLKQAAVHPQIWKPRILFLHMHAPTNLVSPTLNHTMRE